MNDSDCLGVTCQAPLLLSTGYYKSCAPGTDEKIALQRMRVRWEESAGSKSSRCLDEVHRALRDRAKAAIPSEQCPSQGRTEAALREAARRALAQPDTPP